MSLILNKIELKNIRTHEHFIFEPHPTGITAVSGNTGTGKSSIIDSLAWVLYGTRVNGQNNKRFIRESVSAKTQEVSATITMTVGGLQYIAKKKIVTDTGVCECNLWVKNKENNELVHLAGPSVKHAEEHIKQILNMDEKGFLTATLIQQKQVDKIVSSTPRERGEVIENLTGISVLTKSINIAREEVRSLQKSASIMHSGDIESATVKLEEQRLLTEELINEEALHKAMLKKRKEESDKLKEKYKNKTIKKNKSDELQKELEKYLNDKIYIQKNLDRNVEILEKNKNKSLKNINEKDIQKRKTEVNKKTSALNSEIGILNNSLKEKEDIVKNLNDYESFDKTKNNKEIKKITKEIEKLNELLNTLSNDIKECEINGKKTKQSIKQLSDGNTSKCPTCKNEIKDLMALKKDLETDFDKLKIKAKNLRDQNNVNNKLLEDLTQKIESLNNDNDNFEIYSSAKKEIESIEKNIIKKQNLLKEELIAQKVIDKQYEDYISNRAYSESLNNAKNEIKEDNAKLSKLSEKIKKLEKVIEELKAPTDAEYKKMTNYYNNFNNESYKLIADKDTLAEKVSLAKQRYNDYLEQLELIKKSQEEHNNLMLTIRAINSSIQNILEFKKERIEHSIPTLTLLASDVLNRFSNGKFIKMKFDEKFNASVVTADGFEREVAQLSGGELSQAAISLRFGITLLLHENEKSMLIFDEILTGQDNERAKQIMETISSMTDCQMIFISHDIEINDIADKTISMASNQ